MKTRLLTTLTAVLIALSSWAVKVQIGGIYYNLDSTQWTAAVTSGGSYKGNITIPATVTYGGTTYSVTSIGDQAFRDCTGLTSINIPNSVTSIGEYAFCNCTDLTSITIPNSVTSIGDCAFYDCTGLTSITIPNSVTSIGNFAFRGCTGLTSITIPNSVTTIGGSAFRVCTGLTSVTIGNSVTTIGYLAFYGCTGLTSITIPNSVTGIGSEAFDGCTGLTSVTINSNIVSKAFKYDLNLSNIFGSQVTTYILGDNVTSIGDNAFARCTGLTSITIPNSVTSIGSSAFYKCTGLTSITIPNSVTSIGSSAFSGCTGLTSITIPNSVTTIGSEAFRDCTSLTSITIPNSVTSIEKSVFSVCTGLTSINIPNSVTSIGSSAFDGCTGLTSVTIPNSVTSIGSSAFDGCTGLTSITIPNSVTSIGSSAFDGCTGLTSITIPNSVTTIGDKAFYGCTGMTSVTINSNNIVSKTYKSDSNLSHIFGSQVTTYILGDNVTSIGKNAFYGCTGLTSITIPESVTSIGSLYGHSWDGAFYGCTGLTSITIPSSVTIIGSGTFDNCTGLTSIDIPNSVTSIGEYAFSHCTGLTSIDIPNSVTTIREGTFYDSKGLTSITIPNSVTSIGEDAFWRCTGLKSITIPESVTSIDYTAFDNCSCVIKLYNSLINISLSRDFKGSIMRLAEKGSHMVLRMWEKYYEVYDIATEKIIPKPWLKQDSYYTTQSTLGMGIENYTEDYEFSVQSDDGNIRSGYLNSREVRLPGLKPETGYNLGLYARVRGSSAANIKISYNGYSTAPIFPSSQHSNVTPTTVVIDPSLIKGDAVVTYRKLTIGSREIDVTKGTTTVTGLIPDNEYSLTYSITANGYDMSKTYKIRTFKLTMTTQQAKVISAGNVIVAAKTNLNDVETGVGFEWRRTDWTNDMASNSSATVLYEGAMEGYIRNLYTGAFWKYRPYYQASDGTRYYGEWVSFDPTNTSYFEPTVHTYATIDVKNNTASVKGYAMRGTDNVAQQGFKYWKVSSNTRAAAPSMGRLSSVDIPSNAKTIQATGQVMTATLTNLEYASDYACVAFVTTTEGETFYGELQTFRTGADVTGISDVVINAEEQTDSAPTIVGYYNLQGQRIAEPQRGQLVIVRYSDGSSRKMYVR